MSSALPRPDALNGTKNCELAAMLYTLGFESVDSEQTTVLQGHGVPGGSVGYWRFLPRCSGRAYDLRVALARGLDAYQASFIPTAKMPVYKEQAYIAAAFHNYRMLVEHVQRGTELVLLPCGFLYLLQRVGASEPVQQGDDVIKVFNEFATANTRMVAALATLGFSPFNFGAGLGISHERKSVQFLMPDVSFDGRWQLAERVSRWEDDAWCSRADNLDPVAVMADAFYNLAGLRGRLRDALAYVRVQAGKKSVLVRKGAAQGVIDAAERFLRK